MKVKDIVISKILGELENGQIPWKKPYFMSGKCNLITGHVYTGINRLLLAGEKDGFYLTYKQAQDHGLQIKAGSKAKLIVFWLFSNILGKDDKIKKVIPMLRYYNVFGLSDIVEGVPIIDKLLKKRETEIKENKPIEQVNEFLSKVGANIEYSNDQIPHYTPALDKITIQDINHFHSPEYFYQILFHELGHWTGHETRMKRDFSGKKYSLNDKYGREELIAEIFSSMLLQDNGIVFDIKNTAAYIQSWIKAIRDDSNIIFNSASQAEKAFKFVQKIVKPELEQKIEIENEEELI